MKTIFLSMASAFLLLSGFAQDNNPYNRRGVDYYTSLNIISANFNAGKVKDINQETINKYSKLIPLQNQVSVELAGSVIKTIKAPGYSLANFIKGSALSSYAKTSIFEMINTKSVPAEEWKKFLFEKANVLRTAKISEAEREMLLSMLAIAYNTPASLAGRNSPCYVETNDYSGPASPETCIAVAMITGFVMGFNTCGIWCGIGGAIIGGIGAALS